MSREGFIIRLTIRLCRMAVTNELAEGGHDIACLCFVGLQFRPDIVKFAAYM